MKGCALVGLLNISSYYWYQLSIVVKLLTIFQLFLKKWNKHYVMQCYLIECLDKSAAGTFLPA